MTDGRWEAWVDTLPAEPGPTHVARIRVDIDVPVIVPPWVSADDALGAVLAATGTLEFGLTDYADEAAAQVLRLRTNVTGGDGRIEDAT